MSDLDAPNGFRPDWDVFCRVIDNHGDLGVCWRLCVDLAERGRSVRLWVDDARALAWMAPQGHPRVQCLPWRDPLASEVPAQVVVEAFGCDPPAAFLARMAARPVPPVWINLEYLSAEPYAERSHGLSSPQWSGPAAGRVKWFFYPGFTPGTGGLIREPSLHSLSGPCAGASWAQVLAQEGHPPPLAANGDAPAILLFGYDQPALPALLQALSRPADGMRRTLLVTPGWSRQAVARWLQEPLQDGDLIQRGHLQLVGLPPVSQVAFDRLLEACSLNLVRGEDSLVRALWAGRPLLWQLYPQDDGAHHAKLQAFLDLHADAESPHWLRSAFEAWNGARAWTATDWSPLLADLTRPSQGLASDRIGGWPDWSRNRARQLAGQQADLTTALLEFVARKSG